MSPREEFRVGNADLYRAAAEGRISPQEATDEIMYRRSLSAGRGLTSGRLLAFDLLVWAIVVGLAVGAVCGCRTPPPPVPPAPVAGRCLTAPPPPAGRWHAVRPCPVALCLDSDGASAVLDEVEARRDWDSEAWARCGVAQ